MIIKLSEKGLLKLKSFAVVMNNFDTTIENIKFEPDDFKEAVVLTVEEAKDVLHSLNCTWSRCPVKAECKDLVKKKIKQAKGK